MQWADLASIQLTELMVTNPDNKNFLFIGAYRDNEVEPTHPLYISLRNQDKKADVKEVKIYPLDKDTVCNFIFESLQHNIDNPEALSAKIFQKTQGNIFFIIQFLTSLNEADLLYKSEDGIWKWNEKALEDYDLAENVVELLEQK